MSNNDTDSSKSKGRLPLYVSIALVATLVICYFTIPSVEQFFTEAWNVLTSNDEKRIEEWVSGFGWLGPVVLVLAMVVQMFLIVIPSVALMVVSVLAYGPLWGSLIILLSVFTASSVGYAIGNYFGEILVEKIIGGKTEQKIEGFIEDYGFWAVVVTRINPFLSNDAISFVGGILNMGYWRFIGATMLGITPLTIFIAIVGQNTDSLKNGLLWGSLVCLVAFGVYVYWDKKK
ncbi:TVP38/TMEM64 family protein [Marixanthomonas ophiurae]|uniref:TVP38/TMEM64 family membrane protein n=1 Tax=Marixanthomonas ophiurae TaxID=387659 RepID=A0A3E1QA89_9FLAO|nr:TVP38/TMEM64 family protein [Marixanthomonas ophiurae]RFN59059.1 TVP38/TMEM64 family protein [Marixanthomonas ophiurae]